MELQDFSTLAEARAHTEIKGRVISPDLMVAFMATFGVGQAANVEEGEAAFALRNALQFGSEFNFITGHPSNVVDLLDQMASAAEAFKSHCIAYANQVISPFAETTLTQLNMAKGIYTEKEVIGYAQNNTIKIAVIDVLPENCIATTWDCEDGYQPENFRKIEHLKAGVTNFKLRTDRKKADGNLFVRIPLENFDFTVELV